MLRPALLRPFRLVLAGLALFLAAAGAGVLVASLWGPERTRAVLELTLSEALDGPVEVRAARIYLPGGKLSWMKGVLLDAEGIEARSAPDADPDLSVERLQAELDPMALLSGRVAVRSVALDGVEAWVGGATGRPGSPDELAIPALAEDAEPVVAWLEALSAAAERALSAGGRGSDVSLADARLRIQGPPLAEGGAPWVLTLRNVAGEGRLRPRGQGARIALGGQLEGCGEPAGIRIGLQRDAEGELAIDVGVHDLALDCTAPALAAILPPARLEGNGALSFRAIQPQEGVWSVAARLDATELAGVLPRIGDGAAVPISVEGAHAGIDLDVDPERMRVTRAFAGAEDTEVSLSGEIERPLRWDANTVGAVVLDRYDLARRQDLIAFLPPAQIAQLNAGLEPLRSGRVEELRIAGQAPLRDWLRAFDDSVRGLLPESVEASARFEGFAVRAGEGETLTDLSGRVLLRGDRIELQGVRGRRAGHWLPVLDASLDGVSQLAANTDLPEIPHAEDAPLMLGLGPMYDIVVDPNRPPGEMPKELLLAIDHLVHPTLVWPLRNLFARANPGEDGIRLLLEHAVWGRLPVRAEGVWTMQAEGPRRVERVAVRVEVSEALEGLPELADADPVWVRGRWHLDTHNLGRWRVLSSTGAFEAEGQDVRLTSYELELGIAGRAVGEGSIDFSHPEELPYRTALRVAGAQAPGIVDKIGFEPEEATGDVTLDGRFHGELRPGRKVMAGMEGTLQVAARNGEIRRRLPAILAIAKATDSFNPFGSRDEMRFDTIDAALRFERGMVHADELRIDGGDLRLVASGAVDGVDPEHRVQAVVGIFFFKALDRVIGVVPVLSDLILGEDQNLMGAYVKLTGPWATPEASLVPMKTVATGPASFAIEGVPRFVRAAITAIQSGFVRPRLPPPPEVAAPPPSGEDS